jgi:hypothetical protein
MAGIEIDGVNNKIDLDDDKDTSISANVDDTLVVEVGGNTLATVTATGATINDGVTITTADNSDTLTLTSTDADASSAPNIVLNRDSSSPADNDIVGQFTFRADNDAGEATDYCRFRTHLTDVSDGTEDGNFRLFTLSGGAELSRLDIDAGETVFNEDSGDIDFRVESNNVTSAFKVDAGLDVVGFSNVGSTNAQMTIENQDSPNGRSGIFLQHPSSVDTGTHILLRSSRSSSPQSFFFLNCETASGGDNEFLFRGEGNAFCDGSFSGGGADYAEYFEWSDGNASDEDRVGYSVVLDGNKIVKATDSDDVSKIIGVISANPAFVGDNDIQRWKQKFLKDDFGREITEEITVTEWKGEYTEEDGTVSKNHIYSYDTDRIPSDVTVPSDALVISSDENGNKLLRRKINPDWNENEKYISREDRKEWATVGLTGKLRLRKGQPTGTNWIKMRDISETVEEWLVR